MAGYKNPHVILVPYSFSCIPHVPDAVQRLIDCLFKINLPILQRNGKLAPVVVTAAARAIGPYNDLQRDLGPNKGIVQRIERAVLRAEIEDHKVPRGGGRCYKEVLCSWSKLITLDFEMQNNRKLVTHNDKLTTALDGVTSRIDVLERRVESMEGMLGETLQAMYKRDCKEDLRNSRRLMEDRVRDTKKKYIEAIMRKERYKDQVKLYRSQEVSPSFVPPRKKLRINSGTAYGVPTYVPGSNKAIIFGIPPKPNTKAHYAHTMEYAGPPSLPSPQITASSTTTS